MMLRIFSVNIHPLKLHFYIFEAYEFNSKTYIQGTNSTATIKPIYGCALHEAPPCTVYSSRARQQLS